MQPTKPDPPKIEVWRDDGIRKFVARERAEQDAVEKWLEPLVIGVIVIVSVPLIPIVAPVWLLGWLAMRIVPAWRP